MEKIRETITEIVQIIQEDKAIKHCRINVINGIKEVFQKKLARN
jgi:hypothetical protein